MASAISVAVAVAFVILQANLQAKGAPCNGNGVVPYLSQDVSGGCGLS